MRAAAAVLALALLASCDAAGRAEAEATRGLELARAGNLEPAAAAFARAVELDPDNLKARYNGALALEQLGRREDAAAQLEAFTRLRPGDAAGWFELARLRVALRQHEPALGALRRSVEAGFADYGRLTGGGTFRAFYSDVRYVALEAVVAQRAGVPADRGFLEGMDRERNYAGTPLRAITVPGIVTDGSCPGKARGESCGG